MSEPTSGRVQACPNEHTTGTCQGCKDYAAPVQSGRVLTVVCIYCGAEQTHRVCQSCWDDFDKVTGRVSSPERDKAQAVYDDNPLRFAVEASDFGWSEITGACGGCGNWDCHEGTCNGDRCDRCPNRKAQGHV